MPARTPYNFRKKHLYKQARLQLISLGITVVMKNLRLPHIRVMIAVIRHGV